MSTMSTTEVLLSLRKKLDGDLRKAEEQAVDKRAQPPAKRAKPSTEDTFEDFGDAFYEAAMKNVPPSIKALQFPEHLPEQELKRLHENATAAEVKDALIRVWSYGHGD